MLLPGPRRQKGRRRTSVLPRGGPARRSLVVLLMYLVAFGGVTYRLFSVQVVHAEHYATLGVQQRARTIALPATRGRIYDRNGDVLATSVDAATIYADPRAYRPQVRDDGLVVPPAADAAEVSQRLEPVLGISAEEIESRLRRDAHFVYLARQVPYALGQEILDLELAGIGVVTEPARVYPAGELAGSVLGFVGLDGDGLAGLEAHYETLLSGVPGSLNLERAPGGLTIAPGDRRILPPEEGTDLVLTIDREIQHVAERAARDVIERHSARAAAIVALDVRTGEILAVASIPGFDPNAFADSEPESRRNRAITDLMEPGSIQKAVTVAAGLEEGIISPDTTFEVGDSLVVGGKAFTDVHQRPSGPLSVRTIVEESSNIGTIQIAQALGAERLARYLDRFGYGRPVGAGYPGEARGAVLPVEQWSATSLPTISIGYGVSTTLLQMATAYGALANDGVAVQPRLVRGTVGEDGRLAPSTPAATRRVVSPETAQTMRDLLADVVSGERGTGRAAAVTGFSVAGKTGTARKPLEDARGYSSEYIASFVGFAPVEDPRIVVAVMVDDPKPIYGGVVAAPVFSEVMSFTLSQRRVPPTVEP